MNLDFELPDLMGMESRKVLVPPLALLLVSVAILGYGFASTGSPVQLGMDFKGGVAVTVNTGDSPDEVASSLQGFNIRERRAMPSGVMLQFGPMSEERINSLDSAISESYGSYELVQVSEVFGSELQSQAFLAGGIAFLSMAVIVLLIFRKLAPAGTIVMAALGDILVASGFMAGYGMELSLGNVAALLMLIGYSVDSNILLTSRMLRGRGSVTDRFNSAFKTGATMAATTLSALGVLAVVSYASGMQVLFEISAVLFAGLIADVLNTWFMNGTALKNLLLSEEVELR